MNLQTTQTTQYTGLKVKVAGMNGGSHVDVEKFALFMRSIYFIQLGSCINVQCAAFGVMPSVTLDRFLPPN